MQLRVRNIVLAALVLALSSCVTSAKRAPLGGLAPAQRAAAVVVLMPQHEIEIDKPDMNAGGGLIGALIEVATESVMDKHRQTAIAPLRDELLDYDFQARFVAAIKDELVPALSAHGVEVVVVPSQEAYEHALQAAPGNALGLRVRYAFDPNFRGIYVRMGASFGRFDAKHGSAAIEPAGQNVTYTSEHGQTPAYARKRPVIDYEDNAPHWRIEHAGATRAALDEAIAEVIRAATDDLVNPSPEAAQKVRFVSVGIPQMGVRKCPLVAERGDRLLLNCVWHGFFMIDRMQIR